MGGPRRGERHLIFDLWPQKKGRKTREWEVRGNWDDLIGEVRWYAQWRRYVSVGANPFAPIVPCHRVVKTDGTVGKFGGCTSEKIALLRQEGIQIKGEDEKAKILYFANVLYDFH